MINGGPLPVELLVNGDGQAAVAAMAQEPNVPIDEDENVSQVDVHRLTSHLAH